MYYLLGFTAALKGEGNSYEYLTLNVTEAEMLKNY